MTLEKLFDSHRIVVYCMHHTQLLLLLLTRRRRETFTLFESTRLLVGTSERIVLAYSVDTYNPVFGCKRLFDRLELFVRSVLRDSLLPYAVLGRVTTVQFRESDD